MVIGGLVVDLRGIEPRTSTLPVLFLVFAAVRLGKKTPVVAGVSVRGCPYPCAEIAVILPSRGGGGREGGDSPMYRGGPFAIQSRARPFPIARARTRACEAFTIRNALDVHWMST
jgi:hypothetical protein